MQIFAHRGFHKAADENTLAAFRAARAIGVDGIETDIRLDCDGTAILFHDHHFGGKPVASFSLVELRAATGIDVPTLEEALSDINGVTWNLEIKTAEALPTAIQLINTFKASRDIFVSSFLHEVVVACCAATGVEGGFLVSHRPLEPLSILSAAPASITTVIWNTYTAEPADFERLHTAGKANWVYGFTSSDDHAAMITPFVSALITDFPDAL